MILGPSTLPGWEHGSDRDVLVQPHNSLIFVSQSAIPALLADGVSQVDIDMIMREVPLRFLTGEE